MTGQIRSDYPGQLADIRVMAMAVPDASGAGGVGTILVSFGQTDDSGRYRLENIPPGRYTVGAGLVDFPTFYPGVTTLTQARIITVTSGSTTAGVDFALGRSPGIEVSGHVIGVPKGARRGLIKVILSVPSPAGITYLDTPVDSNGTFEFLRVPPGDYELFVVPNISNATATRIEVVDKDVTGIELAMTPVLVGRVEMDRGSSLTPSAAYASSVAGLAPPDLPTLARIQTRRIDGGPPNFATVWADGSFAVSIPEGEFRIAMSALPFGYFVKSISGGSADWLQFPVAISEASPPEIRVTLTTTPPDSRIHRMKVGGRVTGIAENESMSSVWVAMTAMPDPLTLGSEELHSGETLLRADGSFVFLEVPAGRYSLRVFSGGSGGSATTVVVTNADLDDIELPANLVYSRAARPPILAAYFSSLHATSGGATISNSNAAQSSRSNPGVGVRVSGRVAPNTESLRPRIVVLSGPAAGNLFLQSLINPDGTFEFPNVPHGTFQVRMIPALAPELTSSIVVAGQDLVGIEIVSPPGK